MRPPVSWWMGIDLRKREAVMTGGSGRELEAKSQGFHYSFLTGLAY